MNSEEMANKIKSLLEKLLKPKYKEIDDVVVSYYDLKRGPLVYVTIVRKNEDEMKEWKNIEGSIIRTLRFMGINRVETFSHFDE